ncbi:hypothetical protein LshimejAT787_0200940 [Lyophyllum shimeji]|uniref:Uncharacterized protein n=1 Tax=Lyophyllum shimeji TaxID=47721 RepID=A0A9P3PFK3_LYOSH|nr:hypothetical protein LshimejAT787_0200940 [Lyophyllum shimeji]
MIFSQDFFERNEIHAVSPLTRPIPFIRKIRRPVYVLTDGEQRKNTLLGSNAGLPDGLRLDLVHLKVYSDRRLFNNVISSRHFSIFPMAENWLDPVEVARDSRIYGAFVLVFCGVAAREVIRTFSFDLSRITGKRTWRWPMAFYFILTWISKVADAIRTCGSSLILVLRTRAVWNREKKVTVLLGVLLLGQVALWVQSNTISIPSTGTALSNHPICAVPVSKSQMESAEKRLRTYFYVPETSPCIGLCVQFSTFADPVFQY